MAELLRIYVAGKNALHKGVTKKMRFGIVHLVKY